MEVRIHTDLVQYYVKSIKVGTLSSESAKRVFAKLRDLADKISSAGLVSPTLIIIGKVVALSPFWSHSCEAADLVEAK